jgi:hypothetical protein
VIWLELIPIKLVSVKASPQVFEEGSVVHKLYDLLSKHLAMDEDPAVSMNQELWVASDIMN